MKRVMHNQVRASNARSIGNYGLWETFRRKPYDADDENFVPVAPNCKPKLAMWRGRALRWLSAGGALLAYVNHWPGAK